MKKVSMTSKCHKYIQQTNPQHREKEQQNTNSHVTSKGNKVNQPALSSPVR